MPTFGQYEVLETVATGSTGTVYRARQPELDRIVAIKELSAQLRGVPGLLERFRGEAQMLASLDDPHVVTVYDYVEDGDTAWIAEEWVAGASLSAVLVHHGQLTPEQSVGVLRGAMLGLAHAHDRGLVHRDIAPNNILLDGEGTSKLVDFGLAAPVGNAGGSGTPAYISPEAARGDNVGTTADVYSSGAVLYTLLSGQPPFTAPDAARMLQQQISAPPPELSGHGPELAALVTKSLAKDPTQRPADARAFLAELEEAATRRFGAGWLERASVAGLVAAAVGALGVGTAGGSGAAGAASETVVLDSASLHTGSTGHGAKSVRRGRHLLKHPLVALGAAGVVVAGGIGIAVATSGGGHNTPTGPVVVPTTSQPSTSPSASPTSTATTPAELAALLPNGRYTYALRITSTNNPKERVGGHGNYPATLDMTCVGAGCSGTLALDAGTTFNVTYDGTALNLSLDFTQTYPNTDDKGNSLPGTFTQRQVTHGSLVGSGGSPPTLFVGTVIDRSIITKSTGPTPITNRGPFHRTSHVVLTAGAKKPAPSTSATTTSTTPSPSDTPTPTQTPTSGRTANASSQPTASPSISTLGANT